MYIFAETLIISVKDTGRQVRKEKVITNVHGSEPTS